MVPRAVLRALVLALALWPAAGARATAQIPDEVEIAGDRRLLFTEPLGAALVDRERLARLLPYMDVAACTASWRGYRARWEIAGGQLFLLGIQPNPCRQGSTELPPSVLFPGAEGKVVASWFSGDLLVPGGRRTRYVHAGYASEYERYTVVSVSAGRVVSTRETTERPP